MQLSEASAYDAQAAEAGQDPRYPQALPLPQFWDQPQSPPAPPASPAEAPRPWWEVRPHSCMQHQLGSSIAEMSVVLLLHYCWNSTLSDTQIFILSRLCTQLRIWAAVLEFALLLASKGAQLYDVLLPLSTEASLLWCNTVIFA